MTAADKLAEALREFADWYEERSGDNECRPLENARAALAAYEREKAGSGDYAAIGKWVAQNRYWVADAARAALFRESLEDKP